MDPRAIDVLKLDMETLEQVIDLSDDDIAFLDKLLGIFKKTSEEVIVGLDNAFKEQSKVQTREMAHKLKGAALNIGAEGLGQVCFDLEKMASGESDLDYGIAQQYQKVISENIDEVSKKIRDEAVKAIDARDS